VATKGIRTQEHDRSNQRVLLQRIPHLLLRTARANPRLARWRAAGSELAYGKTDGASVAADVVGLATAASMAASAAGVAACTPSVAASTKACAATGAAASGVCRNGCAAQQDDRTGTNRGKVLHDMDALRKGFQS
jgi:hypothetical protein